MCSHSMSCFTIPDVFYSVKLSPPFALITISVQALVRNFNTSYIYFTYESRTKKYSILSYTVREDYITDSYQLFQLNDKILVFEKGNGGIQNLCFTANQTLSFKTNNENFIFNYDDMCMKM